MKIKMMKIAIALGMGPLAQAAPILTMKPYLPNGIWAGTDGNSGGHKTCQITVNWLSDDELQIATTTQYENSLPQTDKVLFLAEKQNEIRLEKLNETDNELSLTQETVILSEEDYQVDLIEQLVLELVDGYKLESIGINVYAIDHESDPSENTLDCRNLIKIK